MKCSCPQAYFLQYHTGDLDSRSVKRLGTCECCHPCRSTPENPEIWIFLGLCRPSALWLQEKCSAQDRMPSHYHLENPLPLQLTAAWHMEALLSQQDLMRKDRSERVSPRHFLSGAQQVLSPLWGSWGAMSQAGICGDVTSSQRQRPCTPILSGVLSCASPRPGTAQCCRCFCIG